MIIDCSSFDSGHVYHIMIQTIIPRPIAWVLSDNGNGNFNLAPFSFFNGVASEPPLFMLSVGYKDEKSKKDTWRNIEERNDFVVHIPSFESIEKVVATSADLPFGESELNKIGLKTEKVKGQRLPRLVGPKAAFFCVKYKIFEVGDEPQALILGEIKFIWLDDSITEKKGDRIIIDPKHLDPLARLGGIGYARLGEISQVRRTK